MKWSVANKESPESIILAVQESLLNSLSGFIADVKKETKAPGLTWEQLDYVLDAFKKKKPTIIEQEYEV